MPKPNRPQIVMSYQSVAKALIIANDLHKGLWRVALTFGQVAGVNADIQGRLVPSAFVPVMGISLVEDETANDLTVDAAVVNPLKVLVTH